MSKPDKEVVEILATARRNRARSGKLPVRYYIPYAEEDIAHLTAAGLEIGPGWSDNREKAPSWEPILLQHKNGRFHVATLDEGGLPNYYVAWKRIRPALPAPPLKEKGTGT